MGICCGKLYNILCYPGKQECIHCKRIVYADEKETSMLISTEGCMMCRLERKYSFFPVYHREAHI